MKEMHGQELALDHVNTISDTLYMMEFMEEAIMTHESFSRRGYTGMEVVIREFRQKLKHSRDFLLDHVRTDDG